MDRKVRVPVTTGAKVRVFYYSSAAAIKPDGIAISNAMAVSSLSHYGIKAFCNDKLNNFDFNYGKDFSGFEAEIVRFYGSLGIFVALVMSAL